MGYDQIYHVATLPRKIKAANSLSVTEAYS